MKKLLFSLFVIAFIACSESSDTYNKRAFLVSDSLIALCDLNFEIINLRQKAWHEAIYDNHYKNPITQEYKTSDDGGYLKQYVDFNEALNYFNNDMDSVYKIARQKKENTDSLFSSIKEFPDDSESVFEIMKELMNICYTSYNMALDAEGSFKSYSENSNSLYQKYKEAQSKLVVEKME
jgi:hypothetical protein